MGFVIQGSLSALTMDVLHLHPPHVLTGIFVLLFAFELTQCFPVSASKGGNMTMFFCKAQGCAANVTYVMCKDENLPLPNPIQFCEGPPPPNTVCQYGGRAFVSIDSDGNCEFECAESYIETEKCTDQSGECAFMYATTTSPVPEKDTANYGLTVGLSIGVVMVLSAFGVIWYFCKRRQEGQQQKASDSVVTIPLKETQSPEETSERDARDGGPGLDYGRCPSQPDHNAQTPAAS